MSYNFSKFREPKNEVFVESNISKAARTKIMIDKLYDLYQRDLIPNDFACDFIQSVYSRFNAGLFISDKQLAKLEELFNKY